MSETKQYIQTLLAQKNISVLKGREIALEDFSKEESNILAVKQIKENQKMMLDKWLLKNRITDIIDIHLTISNGTVGKPYTTRLNFANIGLTDLSYIEFENLDQFGLEYNSENEDITGTPIKSGDFKIKMLFRVVGEPLDSVLNEKLISLIINADPKSLWKNIPSDWDKDEEWKIKNHWKPDDASAFQSLGEKHIVVSSKRGRSHANVGSFRDDDFAFTELENSGWSVVSVADGAGSSSLARLGSKLACESVINYFEENLSAELISQLDDLITNDQQAHEEARQKDLDLFLYKVIGGAAFSVHKSLQDRANKLEAPISSLHTTLIFALFKKYSFGYAILSFGVGDCPIGVLNKDMTEIKLMNWLDVGEFGGGTRFITMPEVFSSNKFASRIGYKVFEDFSYLILMTDGIYDPKFVVEANLEKLENWKTFINDLQGESDSTNKVEIVENNQDLPNQLSNWMDFWSSGNHDDRTLAIVF